MNLFTKQKQTHSLDNKFRGYGGHVVNDGA